MSDLDQKIHECDAKIAKLESQIADLKSYRRGLEHARDLISDAPKPPNNSLIVRRIKITRRRAFSPTWTQILTFIGNGGEIGKSLDDVMLYADLESLDVNRNTARSQLHTMKVSGVLERLEDGRVRLTPKGMEAIDFQKSEDPPVSGSSS